MAQVEKGLLLLLLKYHIKEKFNLLNALFFVFHFFQGAIFKIIKVIQNYPENFIFIIIITWLCSLSLDSLIGKQH